MKDDRDHHARSRHRGVDTHLDVHVAAALNSIGGLLGVRSVPTTAAGYRRLSAWLRTFAEVEHVGSMAAAPTGAGLTRHLLDHGIAVVESTVPTVSGADTGASRILSTPSPRPGPPNPVTPPAKPRAVMEESNP